MEQLCPPGLAGLYRLVGLSQFEFGIATPSEEFDLTPDFHGGTKAAKISLGPFFLFECNVSRVPHITIANI
jgi:hypothetical protein